MSDETAVIDANGLMNLDTPTSERERQTVNELIIRGDEEDASLFEYQVKVTFTRVDTTDVFDSKEKATEFARQQLRNPQVEKVAIKKKVPTEESQTDNQGENTSGET